MPARRAIAPEVRYRGWIDIQRLAAIFPSRWIMDHLAGESGLQQNAVVFRIIVIRGRRDLKPGCVPQVPGKFSPRRARESSGQIIFAGEWRSTILLYHA
jgi:hypothetical protein